MASIVPFLPFIILFLAIGAVGLYVAKKEREAAEKWEFIAEGTYDRAEYGMSFYTKRSGAMVHTTSTHEAKMTAVFFEDGRCVIGRGHYDMLYPKGTQIRIWKNPYNSLLMKKVYTSGQ